MTNDRPQVRLALEGQDALKQLTEKHGKRSETVLHLAAGNSMNNSLSELLPHSDYLVGYT